MITRTLSQKSPRALEPLQRSPAKDPTAIDLSALENLTGGPTKKVVQSSRTPEHKSTRLSDALHSNSNRTCQSAPSGTPERVGARRQLDRPDTPPANHAHQPGFRDNPFAVAKMGQAGPEPPMAELPGSRGSDRALPPLVSGAGRVGPVIVNGTPGRRNSPHHARTRSTDSNAPSDVHSPEKPKTRISPARVHEERAKPRMLKSEKSPRSD